MGPLATVDFGNFTAISMNSFNCDVFDLVFCVCMSTIYYVARTRICDFRKIEKCQNVLSLDERAKRPSLIC